MKFKRGYVYEPAKVIEWGWSPTFGRKAAFVEFTDGHRSWTFPKENNMEITGRLENWHIVGDLCFGEIYDDAKGRFRDGTKIQTSTITKYKPGDTVITTRNSVYLLGEEK